MECELRAALFTSAAAGVGRATSFPSAELCLSTVVYGVCHMLGIYANWPKWNHCMQTNPVDVIKVRQQLAGPRARNVLSTGASIVWHEGPLVLSRGITAALARGILYGGAAGLPGSAAGCQPVACQQS